MYEYIKRTDAIAEIDRGDLLVGNNAEWAREIIWRTPYADVAPVKHGRWYLADDGDGVVCSECGEDFCNIYLEVDRFKYCPNCGAYMRETYLGNCGY